MGKKRKKNINIYSLLLLTFLVFSCENNSKSVEFRFDLNKDKVEREIKTPDSSALDLAKITPFDWSELFIFKPYTLIEDINNDLGFIWENAAKSLINQEDTFNLLVFTKNRKVVNYIKWPRDKGDFIRIVPINNPYSKEEAKFFIKSEKFGNQNWLFFYKSINK